MAPKKLIASFRFYLDLERNFAASTVNSYSRTVASYLASGLDVQEFMYTQVNWNHNLAALKSFEHFVHSKRVHFDASQCIWIENAQYVLQPPKIPVTLSHRDIYLLLQATTSTLDHLIINTLYSTGIRITELLGLTKNDIHDNYLNIQCGKGSKQRLVPISKQCRSALIKIGSQRCKDDQLFTLSKHYIYQMINTAAIRANLRKKVTPHTLRHTFATHLYNNGAQLWAIQQMLGHSNIGTTEIYTRTSPDNLRFQIQEYHPRS